VVVTAEEKAEKADVQGSPDVLVTLSTIYYPQRETQ